MSAALDTLGAEIRAARGARTMREVCAAADISLGYLCDIEYGRRACQIHAPRASLPAARCGAAGPATGRKTARGEIVAARRKKIAGGLQSLTSGRIKGVTDGAGSAAKGHPPC